MKLKRAVAVYPFFTKNYFKLYFSKTSWDKFKYIYRYIDVCFNFQPYWFMTYSISCYAYNFEETFSKHKYKEHIIKINVIRIAFFEKSPITYLHVLLLLLDEAITRFKKQITEFDFIVTDLVDNIRSSNISKAVAHSFHFIIEQPPRSEISLIKRVKFDIAFSKFFVSHYQRYQRTVILPYFLLDTAVDETNKKLYHLQAGF